MTDVVSMIKTLDEIQTEFSNVCIDYADSEEKFLAAKSEFEFISGHSDSAYMAEECASKAELARKDAIYNQALKYVNSDNIGDLSFAVKQFESIPDPMVLFITLL